MKCSKCGEREAAAGEVCFRCLIKSSNAISDDVPEGIRNTILRDQKDGLWRWLNNKGDIELKYRKEIEREIIELDYPLNDRAFSDFIEHLAKLSLGLEVTNEEAQKIMQLCKNIETQKQKMEISGSSDGYYNALKELDDYREVLKNE